MELFNLTGELDFNWKYKDYELRACPTSLARLNPDDKNTTIDFVKWFRPADGKKPYCFSIAYFVKDNEGYDLKFVGDRPFKYIEEEDLLVCWTALKMASGLLNNWHSLTYKV